MPLPEGSASPRRHVHTRAVNFRGYEREDGLWDIEAHMTDVKTYPFNNNWRGEIVAGEPLHEMLLRVTIDDDFVIRDIVAATDNSPFAICPEAAPAYESLTGIRMGPGWRKEIRSRVGGRLGCTHLTELLFPMATVAMQTLWPVRNQRRNQEPAPAEQKPGKRPAMLNTCHAWSTDSPVVKELTPKYYTGA